MILDACALALLTAVCAFLLREFGWRGVPLLAVVAVIGVIAYVLPYIYELRGFFEDVSDSFGLGNITSSVLKVIGIGYLAGIVSDVCRDMGEGSVASAVVLVGRVEILLIAAPYFFDIVKLGVSLIE